MALFRKRHLPARPAAAPAGAAAMLDRRKEPRSYYNEALEITISGVFGRTMTAVLLDLSPSGMRVRLERRLSIGTHIHLTLGEELIFGHIQRCVPVAAGYDAGIVIRYAVRAIGPTA